MVKNSKIKEEEKERRKKSIKDNRRKYPEEITKLKTWKSPTKSSLRHQGLEDSSSLKKTSSFTNGEPEYNQIFYSFNHGKYKNVQPIYRLTNSRK